MSGPITHKRSFRRTSNSYNMSNKRTRYNHDVDLTKTRIVIIDNLNYITKNCIWMNTSEVERLYRNMPKNFTNQSTQQYVQIANRVYQIAITNFLEDGEIGISHRQWDEFQNSIFSIKGNENITISPFHPPQKNINRIKKILFEIDSNEELGGIQEYMKYIDLPELQNEVRFQFRNKFVFKEQTLLLSFPFGHCEAKVVGWSSQPSVINRARNQRIPVSPFGFIEDSSEIHFILGNTEPFRIVNREIFDSNIKFNFSLKLLTYLNPNSEVPKPIRVDYDKLIKTIRDNFNDTSWFEGMSRTLFYDHIWKFKVTLDDVIYDKPNLPPLVCNIRPDYENKFRFKKDTPIEIVTTRGNFKLTQGISRLATKAVIEILSVNYRNQSDIPQRSVLHMINAEQFKESMKGIKFPVMSKQKHITFLKDKKIQYRFNRFKSNTHQRKSIFKKGKWSWLLPEDTKFKLKVDSGRSIALVDNNNLYSLKEITLIAKGILRKDITVKKESLIKAFRERFKENIGPKQSFSVKIKDLPRLTLKVHEMKSDEVDKEKIDYGFYGELTDKTKVKIITSDKHIKFNTINVDEVCKDPTQKIEELGLGGISKQMKRIVRTIFILQGKLKDIAEIYGKKPKRGLLLYGPPGTGKTTLARHIGTMIGCDEDEINMLCGTELFNMWAGESERLVRELFKPAREHIDKHGDDGKKFILIIDEIDALLKKRGTNRGSSWRDSVVNQFLAEFDGLNQIPNILIIGITNRKEVMDTAVLRPGRFDEHIEIPYPDSSGRKKIFEIYTKRLVEKKLLDDDVDFDELVLKTEDFSGADIEGWKEKATDYPIDRLLELKNSENSEVKKEDIEKVTMKDCLDALDEMKKEKDPLGVYYSNQKDLKIVPMDVDKVYRNPIKKIEELGFGGIPKQLGRIMRTLFYMNNRMEEEVIKRGKKLPNTGILIHGVSGTGKTTLAKHFGSLFGCEKDQIKYIDGQEIFEKWKKDSDTLLKEIFKPYREYSEYSKNEGKKFFLIIDRIDSILLKPGKDILNSNREKLINKFVKIMDGLHEKGNIIVVGITNNLEKLDINALKPKCFGEQVEIPLPDENGRKKIFQIYTRDLQQEGLLGKDVNFFELARDTDRFTGETIKWVVEKAKRKTLIRLQEKEVETNERKRRKISEQTTMNDFYEALREIKKDEGRPDSMYM